jgi:translation initiation factor 3 subunit I
MVGSKNNFLFFDFFIIV